MSGTLSQVACGKLRVVVAECSPGQVLEALHSLYADASASVELTAVSSSSTLLPTVRLVSPQVVFVDLSLDPAEPMAFIRTLRREVPDIPIITLADSTDKQNAQQSLQEGATDYLLKGYTDVHAVERVLRGALRRNTVNGLTDLLRDPSTQLYNSDGFSTLARRALQTAEKSLGRLILLTARISNVQNLEEEFGPAAADAAIRDVAALLKGSFRRTDVVARLGEVEFAVLAPDALEPSAAVMRQRVERHLASLNKSRDPWGEIALQLTSVFWTAASRSPFHELCSLVGGYVHSRQDNQSEFVASNFSRRTT